MPTTTLPSEPTAVVSPVKKICIDEMFKEHCGEFGRWQLIKHFILTNLAWVLAAFHSMVMIFADHENEWRCVPHSGCDAGVRSVCSMRPGSWEWVGDRGSSTASEWGLICGEKYKVGLVHALFFVGSMIGTFLLITLSLVFHL